MSSDQAANFHIKAPRNGLAKAIIVFIIWMFVAAVFYALTSDTETLFPVYGRTIVSTTYGILFIGTVGSMYTVLSPVIEVQIQGHTMHLRRVYNELWDHDGKTFQLDPTARVKVKDNLLATNYMTTVKIRSTNGRIKFKIRDFEFKSEQIDAFEAYMKAHYQPWQ